MNSPIRNLHVAQQNRLLSLRMSAYVAAIGGLLALILFFWTPFYISYFALAVGVGSIAFFIQWFGARRRTNLGPLATLLTIFAAMIGREELLPHDFTRGVWYLFTAQFLCVWTLSYGVLHILFSQKLRRDFDNNAA